MSGQGPYPSISGIILTGFMGAGKSTTGALLAVRLGWRFLDSDRVIEERARRTIAEIFANDGEDAFRALESSTIRELASNPHVILALGGGALEHPATRAALQSLPDHPVVFLDAPFETLIGRCASQEDAPVRPVLRDRERLAERWHSRLPLYREAHLTIPTAGRSPEDVADTIVAALFPATQAEPATQPEPATPHGGLR